MNHSSRHNFLSEHDLRTSNAFSTGHADQALLVEHDLYGKPDSTHRVKPEGMLFRIML
jgi:hypothetical protein